MNDEERLAELLIQWEEARDQGQEISITELCRDCPHLSGDLARRVECLQATSWMDNPLEEICEAPQLPELPEPEHSPRTLGNRYRLVEKVAEGGFAEVWKGYDLELLRHVAIKIPKPSQLGAGHSFLYEARRVARLKHPGIVPVHDVGQDEGALFIVADFVEGGSLADRLKHGPVPHPQSLQWIAEIAEALDYAHQQGVIHRDIKPANILIDHHGRALLADFGIALSAKKSGQFAPSLGTLPYMSPEQLEGHPVDPRSDIYSLGVMLWQSLTGESPYDAQDANSLKKSIVAGAVRLRNTQGSISPQLRRICLKCLAHDPRLRYHSARQLAQDLRSAASINNTRHLPALLGIILIATSAAFLLWLRFRRNDETTPRRNTEHGPVEIEAAEDRTPKMRLAEAHQELSVAVQHHGGVAEIKNLSLVAIDLSRSPDVDPELLRRICRLGSVFTLGLPPTIRDEHLAALRNTRGLRILRMGKSQISDAGLVHLTTIPDLDTLEVDGCPLTDTSVAVLNQIPRLTWLDISATNISDQGLQSWTVPPNLRILRANSNPQLTAAALDHLWDLTDPQLMEFVGTQVSNTTAESLRQRYPRCKIVISGP